MVKDNIERDDDAKVKRPDSLEKADVRSYNEKITAILEYLKYRGYGEYLKQDSTPTADRAIMEMPTPPAAIVLQDVDQVGLSADELNARRSANRDAISVHTDATRKYAADLETFGKANEVIQRFNQRNADLRTGHQKAIGVLSIFVPEFRFREAKTRPLYIANPTLFNLIAALGDVYLNTDQIGFQYQGWFEQGSKLGISADLRAQINGMFQ